MKTRRIAILALALITVMTLGVGYAALNDALTVNGTGSLTVSAAEDQFDEEVYFVNVVDTVNCTANVVEGEDTASVTIENTLAIVGDTATATFTVKNDSAVPVTIVTNTSADSTHFRVTAVYPDGNSIAANSTITVTVQVVLKQTVAADVNAETFNITFNASSAG